MVRIGLNNDQLQTAPQLKNSIRNNIEILSHPPGGYRVLDSIIFVSFIQMRRTWQKYQECCDQIIDQA